MSKTAQESRVDALLRIVGFLVLSFGLGLVYLTYTNATVAGQAAPLLPVYYTLGILLFVTGVLATFSKFK